MNHSRIVDHQNRINDIRMNFMHAELSRPMPGLNSDKNQVHAQLQADLQPDQKAPVNAEY